MQRYLNRSKIEILKAREYALTFFTSMLYAPISILIPFFLWKYIYKFQNDLSGMELREILFYLITIEIVQLSYSDLMAEVYYIFQDINTGALDITITKPINYLLSRYFSAVGRVAITLPMGLISFIAVGIFFKALNINNIIFFTLSLFLGFTLFFTVLGILGISTFWLKSVLTLRDIFWFLLAIFSGQIFPLKIIGDGFFKHNPLAGIYYIPSIIVQEKDKISLILEQLMYLGIFVAILMIMWKIGIKKYESQGG